MGEEVRPADRESFTTRASAVHGYAWYSIAAARGRIIGKKGKELVATLMIPDQIAEAQKLSSEGRRWYARR